MTRELEAEVHCPDCRSLYGQIFRVQKNETLWTHETEPAVLPINCPRCETILERKRK